MAVTRYMRPEKTWDSFWKSYAGGREYDASSIEIARHLRAAAGPFAGKDILECGCGTGRISALVARDNGNAFLLDYSPRAIEISRQFFDARKLGGEFTQASLFSMPFPDGKFDAVWNAGVLEHFPADQQLTALREMARVCKPGGLVILMNPFSRAYLYRLGKWWAERTGQWRYGDEFPVTTLRGPAETLGLSIAYEYSFGFALQANFLQYVPGGTVLKKIIARVIPEKAGLALCNGYLLMSVLKKETMHRTAHTQIL